MLAPHVVRWSAIALAAALLLVISCSSSAAPCDGDYKECGAVCCLACDDDDPNTCNNNSNVGSTSGASGTSGSGTSGGSGDGGHCQSSLETPCNGKCVHLVSDVNNCGECGNVCKPDLAGRPARCFASECQ